MNRYGRSAKAHWSRWLPIRYAQIQNPDQFFADLGTQIEEEVISRTDAILAQQDSSTDYLTRVGQINMARLSAEEAVMGELAYLKPETPDTEADSSRASSPQIDANGMPSDRSHPLWEAEHDPEISPEQYQAMLRQWHEDVQIQAQKPNP